MNHPESQQSRDPRDPERLLARGLRSTTPEFEARFDALRRRLAAEPPRRSVVGRVLDGVRGHPAWSLGATATAAALLVLVLETRGPRVESILVDETGWYVDVLALDDSLRGALVLTDPDALETLSLMPVDSPGGGS